MIRRIAGETGAMDSPRILMRLIRILASLGYLSRRTARRRIDAGLAAVEAEMAGFLFDRNSPRGLLTLLEDLNRTATLVRDRLSIDAWQTLDAPRSLARRFEAKAPLEIDDALAFLNEMLRLLAAFNGMQMENMTRSTGWRLLDVGRRVERCEHTAKIVRELVIDGDPAEDGGLDLLLELGDSAMTYRTRYFATVQLPAVLDLLISDDTNPRSLAFQADVLLDHLANLPRDKDVARLPRQNYLAEEMRSAIRLADMSQLALEADGRGRRARLDRFLRDHQESAQSISDALAQTYFTHVLAVRSSGAADSQT
jgi:uncharacterized alpha-E superfamily protein